MRRTQFSLCWMTWYSNDKQYIRVPQIKTKVLILSNLWRAFFLGEQFLTMDFYLFLCACKNPPTIQVVTGLYRVTSLYAET